MADIQGSSSILLEIDYSAACLRRAGLPLQLRPKSFDVLAYLSRNRGRLISKTELIDQVWGHVAVTENSLVQCIKDIRHVLNGGSQFEIRTVPKRGYLFEGLLAEVTVRTSEANAGQFPALPDRPSIAVLPFENLSDEPDQEHFADGVTEDLITGLSRIKWLFVIARNSTFIYKDRPADVSAIGRELGVRYLLRGSIRRAAKRLRISAQLIEARNGLHHWAEQYDRELGDIFAVQDEIARNVVGAIEPFVLAAEGVRASTRSAQDLGAWEQVARALDPRLASQRRRQPGGDRGPATNGGLLARLRAGAQPARLLPGLCRTQRLDRPQRRPEGGPRAHASRRRARSLGPPGDRSRSAISA